jgi:molybdenum cofactor biosynthesis protein B
LIRVVTVTVSDTRTHATDESGRVLREELRAFHHVRHVIVKDDPGPIAALVSDIAHTREADAIVLTGGTGIGPRDKTLDVVERLFERRLDGFGEAFRRLSWDEIGPRSILSRAAAGVVGRCIVFALPGSSKAARLGARDIIAPLLPHAVDILAGKTAHS